MKFCFIINTYQEIQTCCKFLVDRWQLNKAIRFYLQLYTEEYFTNLLKYTSHTKNSFGLRASYQKPELHLLFWDKTFPFNPQIGTSNGLGTRLLTQLFPYQYRTLKQTNFFEVKIKPL